MEYLFYSVVAVCLTILIPIIFCGFDGTHKKSNHSEESRIDYRLSELHSRFDSCQAFGNKLADDMSKYVKDLEDVKKRVDVLTLKAGFKL